MSSAPFEEGFSSDIDSGYVSGAETSSRHSQSEIFISKPQLKFINAKLSKLPTEDILKWCITTLPGLYQETALGLSGLVILDMLSKLDYPLKPEVACIFIDTLHHFDETLALLERVKTRYPATTFNVYKPAGVKSADDFAAENGENFWETDPESYDYAAKVEPSERAYTELNVQAALTGRRKTQGGKRGNMEVVEIDSNGLVKVNPLMNWSFQDVSDYIQCHDVPYNELLDRGYKSIGDWHSTQPVAQGEDERAGRWKGKEKTECGLHNPNSRYAQYMKEMQQKETKKALNEALEKTMQAA